MPQMIPANPVDGCPGSEATVFEALKEGLPKDWIVIHSKRFVLPGTHRHPRSIEREVDFIIFNPKRGYIGLEVKGGKEIGRDQDGWYSVDYYGKKHRLNKDPGAQAQSAIHTMKRYLEDLPDFAGWSPAYGWGVCFPGVTVNQNLDAALPKEYVVDKAGLNNIREELEKVFIANGMNEGLIPQAKIDAFLRALAPTFKLAPSLSSKFDSERPTLVRLTEEQNDILDMFEEFNRVAVKGAAGTGKTVVAMEKARRLAASGKRVLFLCYNRPLADHLSDKAEGYVVETFHRFAKSMCQRAGIKFNEPHEVEQKSKFWDNDAAELLENALQIYPDERYDAVIVDEAQDFKSVWWIPVESMLADGDKSTLYVFFDPNQQIYGGGPADELGLKGTTLKYNCRNTKKIADYSCKLVELEPIVKPGSPEGENVIHSKSSKDGKDMVDAVRKLVHKLVGENGIQTSQIAILTTGKVEHSPIHKVGKLGNISLVPLNQKPGPNEVRFSTLHRFKGLEADVVIVCDVKANAEESSPKHLYVATSRARHLLAVYQYTS